MSSSSNTEDVSANAKYAVHPTVKRLISSIRRCIETPQRREVSRCRRSLARLRGLHQHLDLTAAILEAEPQKGPLRRPVNHRLLAVDLELETLLDIVRDARHDPLARSTALDVDPSIVGVAHEPMPAPLQLPVEIVEHDVAEQRRERRTLRGPLLARVHQPASHDARLEVAPNQLEHPLVRHPSCDRIRPPAFTAHPPRLRDGPLMDIRLRHAMLARPDRPASHGQPTKTTTVIRCAMCS